MRTQRCRDKLQRSSTTAGAPVDPNVQGLATIKTDAHADDRTIRAALHGRNIPSRTIVRGISIASSPQFLGSNPAEVRSGPMRGTRALAAEEDLARALLGSLDHAQRAQAVISPAAPDDILTSNARKADVQEQNGIAYAELSPEQRGLLLAVIEEYAGVQQKAVARQRVERIRAAGFDRIRFAWMGGLNRGERHYYRIQGPTFIIEYDNTQNEANHIHSVWRDFDGDFGIDLLEQHYSHSAHHQQ